MEDHCVSTGGLPNARGEVELDALLAALDGHIVLRTRVIGTAPMEVGAAAARDLLGGKGGRAVLDMESIPWPCNSSVPGRVRPAF